MLKNIALLAVLLGGLMGCAAESSSNGTSEKQRAAASLQDALEEQKSRLQSLPPLDATQADCVASGLVDSPGTDALVEHGILSSDLSVNTSDEPLTVAQQPATQMVDVITGCVDLAEMQREEMQGDQDPPAVKECFEETLDEAGVRQLLLTGLTGDRSGVQELNRTLRECIARNAYGEG